MGAGRTECMKVLYGALPRTSGYVTVMGMKSLPVHRRMAWQTGIVYISEDRKRDGLVLGMSVKRKHVADSAALLQPRWRQFEACR
ncbi:hypothetical protein ACLB1N_24490 [Escherichia coli]